MAHRTIAASVVVFAAMATAAVVLQAGQTSTARGPGTSLGRAELLTAWGDPDLQGVWTSGPMIDVPFERAVELGTRATLTDEEFNKKVDTKKRERQVDNAEFVPSNSRGGMGFPPHWLERGSPSRQASLIVDPPDGRLPPLTSDGARRAEVWRATADYPAGPEELNAYDRCITRGVLGSAFPNIYNSASRIFQTPGFVVIHHEMIHETRIVPLDGRPHVRDGIRLYMGDPRGHWEGQTLVIETTNFNGKTGSYARNGNGNPTSLKLRLVERYTRTDDRTLQYEVRVEDQDTYTAPWKATFPLSRDPAYTLYEYACHEGNYALPNILRAARAHERAATEAK